jgi:iron complex outermembrane receptor protein
VVTATRFETSIDTAPVNVTTITADDIERSSATTLSDVLKTQTGINVTNLFGISGSKAKVDMGGFGGNGGQNTLVLLNGRRLNDVDLQGANLAAIPLDSIAQIEIVRGSSTVLYGDNAVSGVINIVTKNGYDGKQTKLKLLVGSFQTKRLSGDIRTVANNTALSLAFDGLKSDGYRDNSAFDSFSLVSEASREYGSSNYGARINTSREELQLPGALDEATFNSDPTASTATLEKAQENRFSVEGYYSGKNVAAELTLSKKHQEATIFGDTAADLSTLSFTPRVNRVYGKHNLIAGVDLYHSRLETDSEFSTFPPTVINASETTRGSVAVYLSDTFMFNKNTSLNVGARHQRVKFNIENNSNLSGQTEESSNDNLNAADITLRRKHRYGGDNYVRLARSFRSPVLDEMYSYFSGSISLLDPQTANHIEVGTRQTFDFGMKLNANVFRMDITNEIAYVDSLGSNVNLDKTRHDGLNLDINQSLSRQISLNIGYAYRKASFRAGTNKSKTIPLVPQHKLNLSGNYKINKNSQIGLDAIHTGKRYFGNDFSNCCKQMPAYTQVNASYSQQFNKWRAKILVNNLTNVHTANTGYYTYAFWLVPPEDQYSYYSLPERAIYISLETDI